MVLLLHSGDLQVVDGCGGSRGHRVLVRRAQILIGPMALREGNLIMNSTSENLLKTSVGRKRKLRGGAAVFKRMVHLLAAATLFGTPVAAEPDRISFLLGSTHPGSSRSTPRSVMAGVDKILVLTCGIPFRTGRTRFERD